MTRTTPDPTFAEAARDELERRARLGARRTRLDAAPPQRALLRQLAVTAAVAALILGAVLGLGRLQQRIAAERPTVAPTTSTTSGVVRPTTGAPLVVPPGYQQHTDAQLRAWAPTVTLPQGTDRATWIRQQILIVHCMARKGFLYDPVSRYEHAMGSLPAGKEEAYEVALHGRDSASPTSWRTAGCEGLALHETSDDPNY